MKYVLIEDGVVVTSCVDNKIFPNAVEAPDDILCGDKYVNGKWVRIEHIIDIESLKQQKKDELSKACEEAIVTGFYSDITGENILYGFDITDQQNWTTQYETVKLAEEGNPDVIAYFTAMGYPEGMVGIKGKGESATYKFITYEQYKAFWLQGQKHITENRVIKYYPLLMQLNSATTKEEIENIQWR